MTDGFERWTASVVPGGRNGPGHGLILLNGHIDAAAVDRIGDRVDDFLAAATRYLVIDATAVDGYDATLLDLLSRVQRRLGARDGRLQVNGLHPALISGDARAPGPATPGPVVAILPVETGLRPPPTPDPAVTDGPPAVRPPSPTT